MGTENKKRSERNRTLTVNDSEREEYTKNILFPEEAQKLEIGRITDKIINADVFNVLDLIPPKIADLIIIDPPYNLNKDFHGYKFRPSDTGSYIEYLRLWFPKVASLLKDNGSLYICGDWKSTAALQQVMEENLTVLNRITWQREKGRGAERNWKNGMEDIWFGVKNKNDYYFDVGSVKLKRKVLAPYRENGKPKDWSESEEGCFRITYPSNFWDDISIPYWSMPENTDHPTQKPEKLIAKLLLASCPEGGIVIDPFLGSGTTAVVAKKLNRRYIGIEINREYCIWAEKRLALADTGNSIQGYVEGVFWDRNTLGLQQKARKKSGKTG